MIGFALATAGTTIFVLQDNVLTGLRSAQWIPLENSLYSAGKLILLVLLPALLPAAGPFVAWNAPLLPAIILVNYLVYRRLIPADRSFGELDRRTLMRMAAGNWGANLFAMAGNLYLPVLVANQTTASEAAFFYVPWLFSLSLQLVAINMMTSLTVEAALDMQALRRLALQALRHSLRLIAPVVALTVDRRAVAAAALRPGLLRRRHAAAALARDRGDPERDRHPRAERRPDRAPRRDRRRLLRRPRDRRDRPQRAAAAEDLGIEAVGIAWTGSQTVLALVMLATILRPSSCPERWSRTADTG